MIGRKAFIALILLLAPERIQAGAPPWALKDTQSMVGSIFRVVCSGTGPSLGFARQIALDSCKVSAVQQLSTEITVKSMSVTSETEAAAYQQEVTHQSQVSGLYCNPLHEESEDNGAEVRLWLLCQFDLSKARVLHKADSESSPRSSRGLAGSYLTDDHKILRLAVIPGCSDLIVRGAGPARKLPCGPNPVSVLLGPQDREIILRAKDYLPKTIFLKPERAARDYAQVFLEQGL